MHACNNPLDVGEHANETGKLASKKIMDCKYSVIGFNDAQYDYHNNKEVSKPNIAQP